MTAQAGDTTSLSRRKAVLRKALRALRRSLGSAQRRRASHKAATHLARVCRLWNARHVAVYLSTVEEIDTAPLLRLLARQGCTLFVPKIAAEGALRFARYGRGITLRTNRFGIAEPVRVERPSRLDVIVLPLVGFDAQGRRLGMGGGYYDRLLARHAGSRRPLRVGLAFAVQGVGTVPAGRHDAHLDAVVTEHGYRRFP